MANRRLASVVSCLLNANLRSRGGVYPRPFFCVPGMFGSLEVKVLYPS
jgi:hypothetical protein